MGVPLQDRAQPSGFGRMLIRRSARLPGSFRGNRKAVALKRDTIGVINQTCSQIVQNAILEIAAKLLKRLAPQAGFEPATLRLTGGKSLVSRGLPAFATACSDVSQIP